MAKNYLVDVVDLEAITEAINKQKVSISIGEVILSWFHNFLNHFQAVVRELEGKKPQLDELIVLSEALKTDGNRQKLHGKSEYNWFYSELI